MTTPASPVQTGPTLLRSACFDPRFSKLKEWLDEPLITFRIMLLTTADRKSFRKNDLLWLLDAASLITGPLHNIHVLNAKQESVLLMTFQFNQNAMGYLEWAACYPKGSERLAMEAVQKAGIFEYDSRKDFPQLYLSSNSGETPLFQVPGEVKEKAEAARNDPDRHPLPQDALCEKDLLALQAEVEEKGKRS